MRNLLIFMALLFVIVLWMLFEAAKTDQPEFREVRVSTEGVDPAGDFERWAAAQTTTTVKPTMRAARAPRNQPKTTAPISRFVGSVPDAIRAGFARFGATVAEQAVRVASCETGRTFDPAARNGQHLGLFQISRTYHLERVERMGYRWEQMAEVEPNIAVAAAIYAEQGWRPWTCRTAA